FLTNESIMQLTEIPEHLLVLGGGYIGLEFGQMFRRYGSHVTVVHQGPQIVPREDPEIAAELQKSLEAEGLQFVLNARTEAVQRKDGSITLSFRLPEGITEVTGSHLLVAAGRTPNTDGLGLEQAGIATNKDGSIKVNYRLET